VHSYDKSHIHHHTFGNFLASLYRVKNALGSTVCAHHPSVAMSEAINVNPGHTSLQVYSEAMCGKSFPDAGDAQSASLSAISATA